ncbi:cation:proton antiporter [Kitasatospora sp. NPDC059327]|uniref:cation:proton antiporter n=1 Tax=Kitasatospora sp. NPDC059327 TaxID=3346803 RepID=UPI003690C1F2
MASHTVVILLLDLALIGVLARGAGALARRCGQPAVIGEVVMGILLGPTVLHGALTRALFPVETRGFLIAFANLGIILFMFVTGLEFRRGSDHAPRRAAIGIGLGSIVLPFVLGTSLGTWWDTATPDATPLGARLFMGLALSVTAFPVLARILDDRAMTRHPLGRTALAGAAFCDLLAWVVLAVVLAFGADGNQPWHLLWLLPYAAVTAACSPLLRRLMQRRSGRLDPVCALAGLLASCAATEWMGLHFVLGAFVFGIVLSGLRGPDGERAVRSIRESAEGLGLGLLMPVYFVVAGWQVDLSALHATQLLQLLVLLAIAVAGKVVGTMVAARLAGLQPREAAILGALMNTRGLTELIVLTAGRQAGLLNDSSYSLLVAMAVLTTLSTGPILNRLQGRPTRQHPAADDVARAPEPQQA